MGYRRNDDQGRVVGFKDGQPVYKKINRGERDDKRRDGEKRYGDRERGGKDRESFKRPIIGRKAAWSSAGKAIPLTAGTATNAHMAGSRAISAVNTPASAGKRQGAISAPNAAMRARPAASATSAYSARRTSLSAAMRACRAVLPAARSIMRT